jgi:hypothetical protein
MADMSPLTPSQPAVAARVLNRAADRFEHRALKIDERVARWQRDRPRDNAPIVAVTLHDVARELRRWADRCR